MLVFTSRTTQNTHIKSFSFMFLLKHKEEKCLHTQSSVASEGDTVIIEKQAVRIALDTDVFIITLKKFK